MQAVLIDDDRQSLAILESFLEDMEFQCHLVAEPAQALTVVKQLQQIDLVFVDLEMPNHNGYEVLELLKKNGITAPIIACTVHISEVHNARMQGFDGFIGKPLSADRFPGQIERVLERQPVWEAI